MAIVTKSGSKTSPREVLERAKATGVEVVDVRFVDLPGTWQHFSLPLGELDEEVATGRVIEVRDKFSVVEVQKAAAGAQVQVKDRVVLR